MRRNSDVIIYLFRSVFFFVEYSNVSSGEKFYVNNIEMEKDRREKERERERELCDVYGLAPACALIKQAGG